MGTSRKGKLPLTNYASLDESFYNAMVSIGQAGVEYAVEKHGFQNQTFNLQDSYGYAVYKDGEMLGNPVMATKKANEPIVFEGISYSGSEEGLSLLKNFDPPSEGWSVVVVAGMVYASFVEEYYGLDVLMNSEQEANSVANNILNNLKWESI